MDNVDHSVYDYVTTEEALRAYWIQLIVKSNELKNHINSIISNVEENKNKFCINIIDSSDDYDGLLNDIIDKKYRDPYNGKIYNWCTDLNCVFTCVEDNHSSPKTYHFFSSNSKFGYSEFVNFLFGSIVNFKKFNSGEDYVLIEKNTTDYYLSRPFRSHVISIYSGELADKAFSLNKRS